MEAASSAPVSGLGLTLAVLVTSVALVLGLGWAARRLLGLPVGVLRVLIAGLIGFGVSELFGRSWWPCCPCCGGWTAYRGRWNRAGSA
jgi:hypothetical protein